MRKRAKKIFIYYASVGSGHKMASLALEEFFNSTVVESNYSIKSIDSFSFLDDLLVKVNRSFYENLNVMTGPIYDYLAHNKTIKPETTDSLFGKNLALITKNFEKHLLDQKPDVAICVHPFPATMISYYKKKHALKNLHHLVCVTDFRASAFWHVSNVDCYSVQGQEAKKDLLKEGCPENKIKLLGIPIRKGFSLRYDQAKIKKRFGVETDLPVVLIQAGSLSPDVYRSVAKKLEQLLSEFSSAKRANFFPIIVVGTNEKLHQKLISFAIEKRLRNVKVITFTEKIPQLMAIANLLVTKAGGLICSEAAAMGTPLLLAGRYRGEERTNTDFLVKNKAAVRLKPNEKIYDKINRLLKNKQKLKLMTQNVKKIARPHAAQDIAKLVGKLLEE